jgi:hypothetical protein
MQPSRMPERRHEHECFDLRAADFHLIGLRSDLRTFSEYALTNKANRLDFDSAILRFASSRRAAENIVHEAIICPRCSSLRCFSEILFPTRSSRV